MGRDITPPCKRKSNTPQPYQQHFYIAVGCIYTIDRNPRKHGARTLGSDIPIIGEEEARAMKPDYFLVLPYHFLPEMLKREKEFVDRGGRFIVPVPTVQLVP